MNFLKTVGLAVGVTAIYFCTLFGSVAFAQTAPAAAAGNAPAVPAAPLTTAVASAPAVTNKVGIGGDCSVDDCQSGLVCDGNICRAMTAKERLDAAEAKAVKNAQKTAQDIADLNAAKEAVKAAHEACKKDAAQCGAPVEQAEGHLRELQKTGVSGGGVAVAKPAGDADVLAFQVNWGLSQDGQVGPKTCQLAGAVSGAPEAVTDGCKARAEREAKKDKAAAQAVVAADGKVLDRIEKKIDSIGTEQKAQGARISALEKRVTALETPPPVPLVEDANPS